MLLVLGRASSYWGVSLMRDRLRRYHYLLIVGCGPRAREMATLIEEGRGMGLRLLGFVDPDLEGLPTPSSALTMSSRCRPSAAFYKSM